MKKINCNLWPLLTALFFVTTVGAQVSTYERTPGYYTFGINGGLAYQEADIPTTLEGYGLGLTLAKNLYYQPGAIFSFDLRGRALYSETIGLDYFRSYGIQDNDILNGSYNLDYTAEGGGPGFVFQNNKTHHAELGLEGVINFNRLREKTNVNLSLFGGIGLDWYNAKTDQSDIGGQYSTAYLGIDTLSSVSYIKDQLKNNILDGNYESTDSEYGKLGFMPSLGIELGYQFTPKFSMGIGHKVTYTRTDLFDGHQWKNNGNLTGDNDIHHYTNLHMRWIINEKTQTLRAPIVDITNPSLSPHTTRNPNFDIRATVKNVSSSMDIQFTVNGYRETFDFRKTDLRSLIRLRPGNNEVVLTATNNAGSDTDIVNIFYEAPIIDNQPGYSYPTVDITNPPYDDFVTGQEQFEVSAIVRNVNSRNNVEVIVNGTTINNFELRNGIVNANVYLNEGRNIIRIGVRNNDGFASDETSIILQKNDETRPPVVDIVRPAADPFETNDNLVTIEARIYNIENRNDIRFTINGYENTDFSFSNNVLKASIEVSEYETLVNITAANYDGTDSDSVIILWEEESEEPLALPVVTISSTSQPTTDPFDPDNCRSTVIASILNINNSNDIDARLNGQAITDFDFNNDTKIFSATVRLAQGTNTIKIRATNAAGYGEDTATTQGCNVEDENQAPVVIINQPTDNQLFTQAEATVKATVLHVSNKRDIIFIVNGQQQLNFTYDKFNNLVTANIALETGNNTLMIEAQNTEGTASDQINIIYQKIQIVRPPKVSIENPANNITVTNSKVDLIAKVTNVSTRSDINVFLNGQKISNFIFDKNTDEVRATLTLIDGSNTIKVEGTNEAGSADESVNVKYALPVPDAPTVTIEQPLNKSTFTKTKVSLTANVINVKNKAEITVTVNGRPVTNFNYAKNQVEAMLDIRAGSNIIIVKATNEGGIAQDQVTVYFELPKPKVPLVNITTPTNNSTTGNASASINASVENIVNKSGLIFTLNGKRTNAFSYQNGVFRADVKLLPGKNAIALTGRNADGEATDNVNVTYLQAPTVKIISPKNNQSFETATADLNATINNVDDNRNVSLTVNGKSQQFTFHRGKLSATLTLIKGRNTIVVSASNSVGRDEGTISLTHIPKPEMPAPEVGFINPAKPGGTSKTASFTITAFARNVLDKKDITLTQNGKPISKFSFNKRTKQVSATINLVEGKNDFYIEGTNESGKKSHQSNLTFVKQEAPKLPPTVTIVSVSNPTVDPFDPNKAKSTVIAKIENVKSKREITFTFNGNKISNYAFDSQTGNLQITLDLIVGNNSFEIKATNKDGTDSASRNIQFGSEPGTGSGGTTSRNGSSNTENQTGGLSRNSENNIDSTSNSNRNIRRSPRSGGQ